MPVMARHRSKNRQSRDYSQDSHVIELTLFTSYRLFRRLKVSVDSETIFMAVLDSQPRETTYVCQCGSQRKTQDIIRGFAPSYCKCAH
jgi:hypothetical protein